MRLRRLSAVAAAALAIAGLSACRTNVGQAAVIDGHRVRESDVAKYLTPDAAPVSVREQTGGAVSVAPRTFVLNTLIDERLYKRLLSATPAGVPSEGDIASSTEQGLNGSTVEATAQQAGLRGFTSSFDKLWVRVQVLGQALQTAAQQGADLRTLVDKLHFPVSVNPRYGAWDQKVLSLSTDPAAGRPDFLKLSNSGSPAAASTAPAAN